MTTITPDQTTISDPHAVPHGHQASLETGLAFINTLEIERGSPVDHLDSPMVALDWLIAHDLMHREAMLALVARVEAEPEYGLKLLGRIRKVRAAMRELRRRQRRAPSAIVHRARRGQPGAAHALRDHPRAVRGRRAHGASPRGRSRSTAPWLD